VTPFVVIPDIDQNRPGSSSLRYTFFKGGDLSKRPIEGRSNFCEFNIINVASPSSRRPECFTATRSTPARPSSCTRPERFPPFHLEWFSASDRRDLERLKAEPVSFASQFGLIFLNFVQFCKIGTAFVRKLNQMDAMIQDLYKSYRSSAASQPAWATTSSHSTSHRPAISPVHIFAARPLQANSRLLSRQALS
jgi:hypothetical protein